MENYNSYNNSILNKTRELIERRFNEIDYAGNLKISPIEVKDNTFPDLHYYVSRGETAAFDLYFSYVDLLGVTRQLNIRVPKLMDNVFVINGKYRAPIITMTGDKECRFREGVILFDRFTTYTEAGNQIRFFDIATNEFSSVEATEDNLLAYASFLTLKDTFVKKLSVKLDRDCPPTITRDLIEACLEYGSDVRKDFILDKKLVTADESFYNYLNDSRQNFLKVSRSKLRMNKKLFNRDMQNLIDKFFNLQSAQGLSVQVPSGINPLSFDSLRNKVVISDKVSYNSSFVDLIDPINTPENNNVNKLNELNQGVRIDGGVIFITCFTKNFELVEISYLDYLNSKVLKNRSADYVNKKVKSEVFIKYRGSDYEGTDFDYIEPRPDMMLSTTTRRIPMINYSDSIRVAMGSSMLKQAVELVVPEPSLVSSGNDEEDIGKSTLVTKYDRLEGTVKSIDNSLITISTGIEGESDSIFVIPNALNSLNNISTTFTTPLKVGDKVSKGDLVVTPRALKEKSFDLGLNALTAFMIYRGFNNEDAVVVSESFSTRMAHYSILDYEIVVTENDSVLSVVKIGDSVSSRSILVESTRSMTTKGSLVNLLDFVGQERVSKVRNNDLIVSNNVDSSIVSDIQIIQGHQKATPEVDAILNSISFDKSSLKGKLPDRITNKTLEATTDIELSEFTYIIRIQLVQFSKIKIGDKLANRFGSKGVVALIEPDSMMPQTMDGRKIEVILNPYSIIGRKNLSQIIEMYLSLIASKLFLRIDGFINEGTLDLGSVKSILSKYYGPRFDKYDKDAFIKAHHTKGIQFYGFETGSFTELNSEDVISWMKELEVEPEVYLRDGRTGKKIKNPILVGGMYTLKLYHLPEYSGKVTPSEVNKSSPIIGKGSYRSSGQSIGEMEMWSLLSYGQTEFLDRTRVNQVRDSYSLLNNLLMVGIALKDDKGNLIGTKSAS